MKKKGYRGKEKRKFIRVSIPFSIRYQKKDKNPGKNESLVGLVEDVMRLSLSKDISESGIRIVTKERFELGTSLAVDIYAPDRKTPIRTLSTVVWTKKRAFRSGYDTGIRFIKVEKGGREDLSFYLSSLRKVEESGAE